MIRRSMTPKINLFPQWRGFFLDPPTIPWGH
jgi:hypothetical protein